MVKEKYVSKIIRYDMNWNVANEFDESGKYIGDNTHPQQQLKKDGMKAIRSESVSVADCWFFEVEELVDPLPKRYTEVPDFKFSKWS